MKKVRILAFVLFGFIATAGQAQMQFGVQVGPQFPLGDMVDYNIGFGLSGNMKYFVTDDVAFGLNLGYNSFGTDIDNVSCGLIPITLMAEYHLSTNELQPYLGFDLGAYILTVNVLGFKDSDLQFGIAPTAGIQYQFKDNMAVTGSLKWNYVMDENVDYDWLGLNLGLVFNL